MEQRLTLLEKETKPQYVPDCLLLMEACALYYDNLENQCVAQLKFRNIGKKVINAVEVVLKCFDSFGREGGAKKYIYDRISVKHGQQFGGRNAILLAENNLRTFVVTISAIAFEDGTVKMYSTPVEYRLLPESKPLDLSTNLLEQYKRDLFEHHINTTVSFIPQIIEGLWQCVCGSWQMDDDECVMCSTSRIVLNIQTDKVVLEQRLNEYEAEQERQRKEAEELQRIEEERLRKEAEELQRIEEERLRKEAEELQRIEEERLRKEAEELRRYEETKRKMQMDMQRQEAKEQAQAIIKRDKIIRNIVIAIICVIAVALLIIRK